MDGGMGIDASAITSAFTTAAQDTVTLMLGILPIALTVFATTWGVRKAIRFFKGTTG